MKNLKKFSSVGLLSLFIFSPMWIPLPPVKEIIDRILGMEHCNNETGESAIVEILETDINLETLTIEYREVGGASPVLRDQHSYMKLIDVETKEVLIDKIPLDTESGSFHTIVFHEDDYEKLNFEPGDQILISTYVIIPDCDTFYKDSAIVTIPPSKLTEFDVLSLDATSDSITINYDLTSGSYSSIPYNVYFDVINTSDGKKDTLKLKNGNNVLILDNNNPNLHNVILEPETEYKFEVYGIADGAPEGEGYEDIYETIYSTKETTNTILVVNDIDTTTSSIIVNYTFIYGDPKGETETAFLSVRDDVEDSTDVLPSDLYILEPGIENTLVISNSTTKEVDILPGHSYLLIWNINGSINSNDIIDSEIVKTNSLPSNVDPTEPTEPTLPPHSDPIEQIKPTDDETLLPTLPPNSDPIEPLPPEDAVTSYVDPLVNLNVNYDNPDNPTSLTIMSYFFEQNSADGIELSVSIYDTKDNMLFKSDMISEYETISLYIPEDVTISHIDVSYIWYVGEGTSQKSAYLNNELMSQNQMSFVSKEVKTFNVIDGNAKSYVNLSSASNENLFTLILIILLSIFSVILTLGFLLFLYVILKKKKPIEN